MKLVRKAFASLALGAAVSAAYLVGNSMIKDVQFAHAQQQVEATRQQIANIQDMAAVYKAVGKAVEPSVVSIDVRKSVAPADNPMLRRFFPDRNGDGQPDLPPGMNPQNAPEEQGTGSGVIVETDGNTAYVVTNNHVAGGATEMLITLSDGREIKNAKLVGADPKSDLAVVKFEADRLIPAKWGNSDVLEKGDIVMAFGSPFGFVGSMTHGIVSALHRQARILSASNPYAVENFIQVDAPINPGNSGGPLVNLRGEVIGINTAIATESGGFQGIGFAIPANQAKFVYDAIKQKGRVVRGWLGVEIGDASNQSDLVSSLGYTDRKGVVVIGIRPKTPAVGKLESGDIITALNGKQVDNTLELRNEIAATAPGSEVKLSVFRAGKQQDVTVKLGEQPDDAVAAAAPDDQRNANNQRSAEGLGLRLAAPSSDVNKRFGLDEGTEGALITNVRPDSAAAMAGFRPGDVITRIDKTQINSVDDARDAFTKADLTKGVQVYITNKEGSRLLFLKSGR